MRKILSLVFLASALFSTFIFLNFAEWNHFDLAGHMASGMSFVQVGLHGYEPAYFEGGIQNLFYPPLEDFLLGLFYGPATFLIRDPESLFNAQKWIFSFYVICLIAGMHFVFYRLLRCLRYGETRIAGALFFLFFFWCAKKNVHIAGLGLYDIVHWGMTAQILSALFFIELLRRWILAQSQAVSEVSIVLLAAATVASHWVMGLVALPLLFTFPGSPFRRCQNVVRVLGLTATVWLPFIVYRRYSVSEYVPASWIVILQGLLLFTLPEFFAYKNFRPVLAVLFILAAFGWPGFFSDGTNGLPSLHYYRFGAPTLLLCAVMIFFLADRFPSRRLRIAQWSLPLLVIFFAGDLGRLTGVGLAKTEGFLVRLTDKNNSELYADPKNGASVPRSLVVDPSRSTGFALDALLHSRYRNIFLLKGLYSESAKVNLTIQSGMQALFDDGSILQAHRTDLKNCEIYRCYLENFLAEHAVGSLWISERLNGFGPKRAACFEKILMKRGTDTMRLSKLHSEMRLGEEKISLFSVQFSAQRGAVSEAVVPAEIDFRPFRTPSAWRIPAQKALDKCLVNPPIYRPTLTANIMDQTQIQRAFSTGEIGMWVKLAPLPGIYFMLKNGKILPHYELMEGYLVFKETNDKNDDLEVHYKRTGPMKIAYGVSLLSAVIGGISIRRKRRRVA